MNRIAELVMQWRRSILVLVIAITVLLGIAVMGVKLNADFSTYLSQENPLVQEFSRVGKVFKSNYVGLVLLQSEDVFTEENLSLINKLTQAYEGLDGVDSVTSLTNAVDFQRIDDGIIVGKLLEGKPIPDTAEAVATFKQYVLSKEMYVGGLVNELSTTAVILVRLLPEVNHFEVAGRIDDVTKQIAPDSGNIYYGGMPFLIFSMTGMILDNIFFLVPLMILLLVGTLELGFRRLGGVLVPLMVVLLAVVWTLGILSLLGRPIELLTGIVPVILIAMGAADGIHFMRRFYEARSESTSRREAIKITMKEMGKPIVFTSITTIIGFASLIISDFDMIKMFGLFTSLGIFLALVATLIVIPAVLSFGRDPVSYHATPPSQKTADRTKQKSRMMERLGQLIHRRPGRVAILTLGLAALAATGIPRIMVSVDWTLCLAPGSKPYLAEMLLRQEFGGSLPLLISVKGDVKDPATLETMRAAERFLEALPNISEAESIASILAEMNWTLNDQFSVPASRAGVNNLWFLLKGQDVLDQLVRSDNREALIQAKVASLDTAVISPAMRSTELFLNRLPEALFVVDSVQVPPVAREAVTQRRVEQAFVILAQDLEVEGYLLQPAVLQGAIQAALSWNPDSADYRLLETEITNYLTSEASEIPYEDPVEASAIAVALTKAISLEGGSLDYSRVEAWLRPLIQTQYLDDVTWLAKTLVYVAEGLLKSRRVETAYAKILDELPIEAHSNIDLTKRIRGDLWGLTSTMLALSPPQFSPLRSQYGVEAVRTVTLSVEPSGMAPVLNQMEKELLPTQIQSTLLALLAVALILVIVFRSLIAGLLGIAPVVLTILFNFAVLGYMGIALDSFTAMIAAITIGLGIDYAIHFTHRYRLEMQRSGDVEMALIQTLQTTGMAILINSLAVGAGFSVLLLAGGQHMRLLGGLTALALLLSALFTLIVLPALTLLWKPWYFRRAEKTHSVNLSG